MESLKSMEKEINASEWCEGSDELRRLLLNLWEHGIETRGCCSGIKGYLRHKDISNPRPYENSHPYIGIGVTPENCATISDMFLNLSDENLKSLIIGIQSHGADTGIGSIGIRGSQPQYMGNVSTDESNMFFKQFNEILERKNNKKKDVNTVLPSARVLASIILFIPDMASITSDDGIFHRFQLYYDNGAAKIEYAEGTQEEKVFDNLDNNDLRDFSCLMGKIVNEYRNDINMEQSDMFV